VAYLVFDLLYADGDSLLDVPYAERRVALARLGLNGQRWQAPPAFEGDGAAARAASEAAGLEGVVAKRLASLYRPGRRSTDWVKAKHQHTQEVVVLGWQPGEGRRSGGVGALVLGVPDADGTLRYAGQVGTGFSEAVLADLARRLRPLERKTSPLAELLPPRDAAGVRWATPKLVGEVQFSEWTKDGRLRHPVWKQLRLDKGAQDVASES
jgi:bifunctional non-homologous end joining protein LigD